MKKQIFLIDSSAILSGKPINLEENEMITTVGVSEEFNEGGRDYRAFELLKEKGLKIYSPSQESIDKIDKISKETGDYKRLSKADCEILALSIDLINEYDVVILTDDYSIQNISNKIGVKFEGINQKGIEKRFKWIYRCPGCKKQFKKHVKICPTCGKETKVAVYKKKKLH